MTREDEIKLIEMMGGKVVPFSDEMKKALKKGSVVCPHGNEGWISHIEYDSVNRSVSGVDEDGNLLVRSEFYCEGSGEALHLSCTCGGCCEENPGGLCWFPDEFEIEYQ